MILGEGKRKVGEECWSHAQCVRSQANSHCNALVCSCDKGYQDNNGECTRNIWDDLGLVHWEMMVVALVLTLMAFALFVGCVYFILSKLLRLRKTSPSENVATVEGFEESDKKKMVASDGSSIKFYETKLVNGGSVESQLVDETTVDFSTETDTISTASTFIIEPTKFIMPLDYKSSDSGYSADTWQSSRQSSTSQGGLRDISRPRGFRQHRFTRAWTSSAAASHDDSDDWFQPNRNHTRRLGPHSPSGTTRLPLLLRASTFSESDESP